MLELHKDLQSVKYNRVEGWNLSDILVQCLSDGQQMPPLRSPSSTNRKRLRRPFFVFIAHPSAKLVVTVVAVYILKMATSLGDGP